MNIQDFKNVVNNQITGLSIVPLRTGSSKTYTAMDFISKFNNSEYKRIIYITNRNNNLPIEELNDAFKRNKTSNMKNKVLVVKSNLDSIVENLPQTAVPSSYQSETYKELMKQIDTYSKHLQNDDLKEAAKNNIENGLEKDFRREVSKGLKKDALRQLEKNDSNLSLKEYMNKLVREETKFHWISEVYPTIFMEDYHVLMMNTSKFLTSYDTIISGAQQFLTAKRIIDGALIIIDEFDQTKRTLLDKIIDQAVGNVGDVFKDFQSFQQIFDAEVSEGLKKIQNPKLKENFKKLKVRYDEIQNKFCTNKNWYLNKINTVHELMFFDGRLNTFLGSDSKKRLYSRFSSESNEVVMNIALKRNAEDNISILGAFQAINSFYRGVEYYFSELANEYMGNQARVHQNLDIKIDYSSALSTVTHIYNMNKKQSEIILNETLYSKKDRNLSRKLLKYKTNSFYDYGMRLTFLENGIDHNLSTIFNTYTIWDTPEKIILYLANKAHVVGLSATAGIDSSLSNYDLNYLRECLSENYVNAIDEKLISSETLDELRIQDAEYINQKIDVNVTSTEKVMDFMDQGSYSKPGDLDSILVKIVGKEFARSDLRNIENSLQGRTIEKYLLTRYLEIIQAMATFFENKNLESFLCLNNKSAKADDKKLDLNFLKTIFDNFNKNYSDNAVLFNLKGKGFSETKKQIKEQLHKGKRVFVLSTYQTIGDGQNIQYTPNNPEKLKCINKRNFSALDQRFTKKDFDGLYLGEITYVIENLNDSEFTVERLLHYLFQIEYLSKSFDISFNEKYFLISQGLKRISGENKENNSKFYNNLNVLDKDSSRRKLLTTVIQAVGRLNRTFNKNEICILISDDLLKKLPYKDLEKMHQDGLLTREMLGISELLQRKKTASKSVDDKNHRKNAKYRNEDCELFVQRILDGFSQTENNDSEKIYDNLRDSVLNHPTLDKTELTGYNEFYIDINDSTYWIKKGDDPDFYFVKDINQESLKEISERTSTLPTLMKNPIILKYFEDNGWPTRFEIKGKMMCFYLFQYIYKAIIAEKAGIALLENKLNIKLKRFSKEGLFEKFDYEFMDGQVVVDFKNWNNFDKDFAREIEHISNKLDEVNGKKAFIINLIDDGNYHPYTTNDNRIVIVQSLINKEGVLNNGNIKKIAQEIAQLS